jgi:hypothetical protein
MRETEDEVPEDSDLHHNNKPETDPVEDGKSTFQGKMKVFSKDTRTFSRKTYHLVLHRKDRLNSKLIWYPAAKLSKDQSTSYPPKN